MNNFLKKKELGAVIYKTQFISIITSITFSLLIFLNDYVFRGQYIFSFLPILVFILGAIAILSFLLSLILLFRKKEINKLFFVSFLFVFYPMLFLFLFLRLVFGMAQFMAS